MNYFLDFGTHYFYGAIHKNGILSFEEKKFFGSQAPYDWRVLTFEPSIHAIKANEQYLEKIGSRFASFEAFHAAVSDFAGIIDFKWCPQNEAGSNCINETVAEIGEIGSVVYPVASIDVKELIDQIIKKDNDARISIKCDIEGSEFTVLPRIAEVENAGRWVKEVFVEWHDRFWQGKKNHGKILETKAKIIKDFASSGIALYEWV